MIKKLLYSFGLISATFGVANAQITITMADIAGIGKVIKQATDTTPTISPGTAGTNQTWNFSALAQHSLDTLTFTNPYWTPFQSSFPTSNLAIEQGPNGNAGISYANLSGSTFNMVGQHFDPGTGPVNVPENPVQVIIPFPSTYNTSFNNTSGYDFTFYFGQFG